ncbi:hypothetical protein NX86_02580 [Streptococcus phocae subsp. salmonis]|nr:hypothetical protein NX86_02580 [Streptococcus phocae subsp. salmonis]
MHFSYLPEIITLKVTTQNKQRAVIFSYKFQNLFENLYKSFKTSVLKVTTHFLFYNVIIQHYFFLQEFCSFIFSFLLFIFQDSKKPLAKILASG